MSRLTQKELIFTALASLGSVAFYGSFVELLKTPATPWLWWYGLAGLAILSLSILMITIALIQHRALRWLASFMPAVAVASFGRLQPAALAGAGLLAITTLIASITVRDHLDDYVKLQARRAFWSGSQLVVIGTIAALACLYFPILVSQLQTGSLHVSERSVEPLLRPLLPVVENLLSSSTPSGGLHYQAAVPTVFITDWLNRHISRLTTESPLLVSLLVLIPVFFASWLLSPALIWPVVLSITGLLRLFRRLRLVRIESRPEPVDHLTLS